MLDHSYQDANELWTNYGQDYCFNDFDLVARYLKFKFTKTMMLNKRTNTPMVPQEEGQKSEPTRLDISVEGPKIDNGQDSQDINFSITKVDGKAYDRNEKTANSVRSLCKCCF